MVSPCALGNRGPGSQICHTAGRPGSTGSPASAHGLVRSSPSPKCTQGKMKEHEKIVRYKYKRTELKEEHNIPVDKRGPERHRKHASMERASNPKQRR